MAARQLLKTVVIVLLKQGWGYRGEEDKIKEKVLLGFPGPAFVILDRPLTEREKEISACFIVKRGKNTITFSTKMGKKCFLAPLFNSLCSHL